MQTLESIVNYYSKVVPTWKSDPKQTKEHNDRAKDISKNDFKSIGRKVFKLCIAKNGIEEEYICNLLKQNCSCKNYLKYKTCPHLVAAYKHFSDKEKKFVSPSKRGRTKIKGKCYERD